MSVFISRCCVRWMRLVAYNETYQANDPDCRACIVHVLFIHRCQCWEVERDGGKDQECKPDEVHQYAVSPQGIRSRKSLHMAREMREDAHEQRHCIGKICP